MADAHLAVRIDWRQIDLVANRDRKEAIWKREREEKKLWNKKKNDILMQKSMQIFTLFFCISEIKTGWHEWKIRFTDKKFNLFLFYLFKHILRTQRQKYIDETCTTLYVDVHVILIVHDRSDTRR